MKKEIIIKLETNIDHLTGEEIGAALQYLNDMEETLDASCFFGTGKKNRPCQKLEVLCREESRDAVIAAVFTHTHTLGVRVARIERLTLPRSADKMEIDGETVRAKRYTAGGAEHLRPEADDLARLAQKRGLGMPGLRIKRADD